MELEELKKRWTALDERLGKNEMLQESLIRAMMQVKAEKSVSRLLNWEVFSVVVCTLILPYSFYVFHRFGGRFVMWDTFLYAAITIVGLLVLWSGYKAFGLMKIDFAKVVKENVLRINRYNIQIRREKMVMGAVVGPLFVLLAVAMNIEMKAPVFMWIFLACVITLTVLLSYVSYKRVFDRNIRQVRESLAAIAEIEETEE